MHWPDSSCQVRVHGSHHPQGPTSHDRQWRKDSSCHPHCTQRLHSSSDNGYFASTTQLFHYLHQVKEHTHSKIILLWRKDCPMSWTWFSDKNIFQLLGGMFSWVWAPCIIFLVICMGVLIFSDYFGLILYFYLLWMVKFSFVFLKTFANIHKLFLPFLASWSPLFSQHAVVQAGENLSMSHQKISRGWAYGYICCMCWVETLCVCGCERSNDVSGR